MTRLLALFAFLLILQACSSGKAALSHGNYYEAALESVNRLRDSPDHKKAKAVLQQGYPLAIEFIESGIQNGINAGDPKKWRNAVKGYEQINYLNDQIKTSLGAMRIITNPVTRYNELKEVKPKAAEESYADGIAAMMKNTRDDSKQAYFNFKEAISYAPDYRESIEMMNQAETNATLRVGYEEINSSSINYGSLQPIVNSMSRQFLSFQPYRRKDTVHFHQFLRINYQGYREDGPAKTTTQSENLSREVKTGEKKGPDGKPQDILTTVTARITYFKKKKNARSSATITITDGETDAILENESIDGMAFWEHEWAIYSGDLRALSSSQQSLCKKKEASPNDRDLFNQSMRNLETDLKKNLRSFYNRY